MLGRSFGQSHSGTDHGLLSSRSFQSSSFTFGSADIAPSVECLESDSAAGGLSTTLCANVKRKGATLLLLLWLLAKANRWNEDNRWNLIL